MYILDLLVKNPYSFHYLRKIPEFNYKKTKNLISQIIMGASGPALDLGCGTGEFCGLFSSINYCGIDISNIYLKFAKRRNPNFNFFLQNGKKLAFKDNQFAVILINGVLHHLFDDAVDTVLAETSRVLKPSGRLLLIEDIPSSRGNFLGRVIHRLDDGDYIRDFSGYMRLVGKHFKIEESGKYRSGVCDYGYWKSRKN